MLPRQQRLLKEVGENLRLARLRRNLSVDQVAERSDTSRTTLFRLERGDPIISLGKFLRILAVLDLEEDLRAVAADDPLWRKLQDAGLTVPERASKSKESDESER